MANQIVSMKKLRKLLKLTLEAKSERLISKLTGMSRNTMDKYKEVFNRHPFTYAQLLKLTDKELYSIVYPPSEQKPTHEELYRLFPSMESKLSRIGVTKLMLWEEYKSQYADGVQYSQFCEHFRRYQQSQNLSYVFDHKAGDKLMVDFAGKKLHIVDPDSGEMIDVEFFVAILPCSGYTYAQASPSQKSQDFLACLQGALKYLGGVPQAIATDNLKPAVNHASKYDPELNHSMADFAEHYDVAILPTRVRKPKDKALVESAVNILYTRVYAPLHDKIFHSLAQLNEAIRGLLDKHNAMLYQQKPFSRKQQFDNIEKQQLKPLPDKPYELKKYQPAKVHPNCHVLLSEDKHNYSVPYRYVGQKIEIGYTHQTVEIFHKYERIAIHQRDRSLNKYSTNETHLHPRHQYYHRWSKDYFIKEGLNIGPNICQFMEQLFFQSKHPEQAFKSCQGVLNLTIKHGNDLLDQAAGICLQFEYVSYRKLEHMLSLDFQNIKWQDEQNVQLNLFHENIRGKSYYQ